MDDRRHPAGKLTSRLGLAIIGVLFVVDVDDKLTK